MKKAISPLKALKLQQLGKKKTQTKPELEREAWKQFSRYVRIRDTQRVGDSWNGKCITCSHAGTVARLEDGKLKFNKGWDAGHFVSRGAKVIKFDEENVNLQCKFHCNKMKSGNPEKYKPALDVKYGEGTWRKLEDLAQETRYYKFSRIELEEIIHDSKEQVKFYENNH